MGRSAAKTETAQLLALPTVNSGAGPAMGDGVNLLHACHGNLGTAATLGSPALIEARIGIRLQKGLDAITPIGATPKYHLGGPALKTAAENLLATLYAN